MIRRLSIVAGLTGSSHVISLAAVAVVADYLRPGTVGRVGVVESSFFLLIALISFGLQMSATRYIAIRRDWVERYRTAQTAKVTLALVIVLIALAAWALTGDAQYAVYLAAPLVALNGDYALYGRGKAEYASFVSFLRNLLPAIVLTVLGIWAPDYVVIGYAIALTVSHFYAGILSAAGLRTRYLYRPKLASLREYLSSINIGFCVVGHFLMTMGIMYVAHYFYDETELGLFYIALKLYMIYQGVKRLIVQSFFRDMIDARVALKVDQLAILSGLPIFIATGLFSASFIMNVYDAAYLGADVHFILLGFAIVVQSVGTSASISILLSEDDNRLTFNLIVSALLTIGSCIVFSFFSDIRGYGISLSILIGESVLFLLNARTVKVDNYLGKRLRFMITPSLMLLVPVAVRCFGGDTFSGLLLSLGLFGAAAALKYFRYFQSE